MIIVRRAIAGCLANCLLLQLTPLPALPLGPRPVVRIDARDALAFPSGETIAPIIPTTRIMTYGTLVPGLKKKIYDPLYRALIARGRLYLAAFVAYVLVPTILESGTIAMIDFFFYRVSSQPLRSHEHIDHLWMVFGLWILSHTSEEVETWAKTLAVPISVATISICLAAQPGPENYISAYAMPILLGYGTVAFVISWLDLDRLGPLLTTVEHNTYDTLSITPTQSADPSVVRLKESIFDSEFVQDAFKEQIHRARPSEDAALGLYFMKLMFDLETTQHEAETSNGYSFRSMVPILIGLIAAEFGWSEALTEYKLVRFYSSAHAQSRLRHLEQNVIRRAGHAVRRFYLMQLSQGRAVSRDIPFALAPYILPTHKAIRFKDAMKVEMNVHELSRRFANAWNALGLARTPAFWSEQRTQSSTQNWSPLRDYVNNPAFHSKTEGLTFELNELKTHLLAFQNAVASNFEGFDQALEALVQWSYQYPMLGNYRWTDLLPPIQARVLDGLRADTFFARFPWSVRVKLLRAFSDFRTHPDFWRSPLFQEA